MGEVARGRETPRRLLTLRHLFVLPSVALVVTSALGAIEDNSFLWHVRAGELQLDAGEVLRSDPFSFTRFGEPWITQSWLAELAYGLLEGLTGDLRWVPAMIALVGLIMLGFAGLAVYAASGRLVPMMAAVTVLSLGFLYFSVPRPVLFSFALLAVLMVVLAHHERLGWTLVPLLWLWAVLHATWIVALVIVGLEAVRRRSVRLAVTGAVAGLFTLLTPHGVASWRFAFDLSSSREALAFLSEWQPPDFTSFVLWPFLLVVVGVLVAAVRQRLELWDLVVVVPVLLLGLMQERTVFVALLILLPFAAQALPAADSPSRSERPVLNWGIAVLVAALSVVALATTLIRFDDRFPTQLVDALQTDAVFHGAGVGGYVIYARGPDLQVFIDDRAELYGASGFGEFVAATRGVGYRELFGRWGITETIAEADWPLVVDLEEDGWREVAAEGEFVLLRAP